MLPVVVCLVAVAALLAAERADAKLGKAVAKLTASSAFVWAAISWEATTTVYGQLLLVGLVLCWAGDALLLPAGKTMWFKLGIAAFLLGHIAYALAFTRLDLEPIALGIGVLMMGAAGWWVLRWLHPHLPTSFRGPVVTYVAVISLMVIVAFAAVGAGGPALIGVGALGFALSDLSVASNRFVSQSFATRAWGLPLYFLSQLALAYTGGQVAHPPVPDGAETVVLVHGLGRGPGSMAILRSHLERAGYRVVSFGYPSTSEPIDELVDRLAVAVDECCREDKANTNFVTHSMGGVLVRSYLEEIPERLEGRVVMLAPPSQGSEVVDSLGADYPWLRWILGPSGEVLGTDSAGIASRMRPIDFQLGIIIGDRSLNPIASRMIPGPDDGAVGIDRARIEGAADFLVVPATHSFIMNQSDVADEVLSFLRSGAFQASAQ
jgi:triacylglycerol lipase